MADFLKWALSDFWRFMGLLILAGTVLNGLAAIVAAARGMKASPRWEGHTHG